MNREQYLRLGNLLPNDATEIIIKGHDTQEVFFSSDADCSQIGALIAQRGSYKGTKRRWRLTDTYIPSPQPKMRGQIIDPSEIPQAPEPIIDLNPFADGTTPIDIDTLRTEDNN